MVTEGPGGRKKASKNPVVKLVDDLVEAGPQAGTDDREGAVLMAMKHFADTAASANPAAEVLIQTALALADDVDTAYSPMQRAAAVKELRGVLIEITEYASDEEADDADPLGWRRALSS